MNMKIVIAADSFKGSCSTFEVANAIENGIRKVFKDFEIIKIPVADGGEGTVDSLVKGTGGRYETVNVKDPLGRYIECKYGILKDNVAVLEMAASSGLTLLKEEERNPLITTTYGTGQMIRAALDKGCKKILIGIGGSATNDGGAGMAQALGVSFRDNEGNEIGYGGGELARIKDIDITGIDSRLKDTEIVILSDVSNPLCGPNGVSFIYGPQKGATNEMVKQLDNNLEHYASIINEKLGIDITGVPGAGAAGGLGAGLIVFCNATVLSGIDVVLDINGIDRQLIDADLVITGEGKIDNQTVYGKVPVGVAKRALKYGIPVIAIVGSIGEEASVVYDYGINAIMDIVSRPMSLEDSMKNVSQLLEYAAENVIRILGVGNYIADKSSLNNK